jgi:Zn finger protein HypA/HybF involved in hydrogenase expression
MHEMAIARRLVAEALARSDGGRRLTDVEVVLSSATGLSGESVRQHFGLAARGTAAEDAAVRITWEPGRYWCLDCTCEFSSPMPGGGTCPRCGGGVLSLDREEQAYVRTIGTG